MPVTCLLYSNVGILVLVQSQKLVDMLPVFFCFVGQAGQKSASVCCACRSWGYFCGKLHFLFFKAQNVQKVTGKNKEYLLMP